MSAADRALEARIPRDDLPRMVEPRPMGWWGMLLLMGVLVTLYAAMYFATIYLRVGHVQWPPEGYAPPPLARAGLAFALPLLGLAPMWLATARLRVLDVGRAQLGLAGVVVLGVAHLGLLIADLAAIPWGVSEHAYVSLLIGLPGIHATVVVCAVIMAVQLLALSIRGRLGRDVDVGARSLGLLWVTLAFGGAGLYAVVWVMPHVWQVAQVGS